MQEADRPLLTIADLSAHLKVSGRLVRDWHQQGEGPPAVLVGRRLRWRPADVETWLAEHSETDDPSRVQAYVDRIVAAAPALSTDQLKELAVLLRPGADVAG